MKRIALALSLLAAFTVGGMAIAEKVSMDGIKCIVSGAPAKEASAVKHLDGQVYFCCNNCPKKFESDKAKFTTKANMQLVATKQYEQGACPYSGGKLNPDTALDIGGVKVSFCCNNCKGKTEKMKDDEKVEAVFNEKAFEKGKFAKVAAK